MNHVETEPPRHPPRAITGNAGTAADSTRSSILRAASRQFAARSYSAVSLDDILGEARVTKGAMYFHFHSKHALALAIIEEHTEQTLAVLADVTGRGLSGLETIIDVVFYVATLESTSDGARAGVLLLESIGRTTGLVEKTGHEWVSAFGALVQRAIDEGDVVEGGQPEHIARLLVALYAGVRQLTDLSRPRDLVRNLENSWLLVLPGVASADRADYLRQFVQRRARLAARDATADD